MIYPTFGKYKLRRKKVVPVDDLLEWALWFETADRRVSTKKIRQGKKLLWVSTVFLGIEHFGGIFETMVFLSDRSTLEEFTRRYRTWSEAARGHRKVVKSIIGGRK